jgi:hypothetical protein
MGPLVLLPLRTSTPLLMIPAKWDIADAILREGWSEDRLRAFIADDARPGRRQSGRRRWTNLRLRSLGSCRKP